MRKQGYEDAAKQFEATADESDPVFRPFLQDPSLWKGAVADSNVAAQQDGLIALCSFLKFGGQEACKRYRQALVFLKIKPLGILTSVQDPHIYNYSYRREGSSLRESIDKTKLTRIPVAIH